MLSPKPIIRSGIAARDAGADPWDVVLICFALVVVDCLLSLGVTVNGEWRYCWRLGLALGYLLFTGTARWSVFGVRYEIPQFVAWSPVIAIALSTLPKMVVRAVLCLLADCLHTSAVPQRAEEPFIHPDYAANSLVALLSRHGPSSKYALVIIG